MKKTKTQKPSGNFIDFAEITETLAKNDEVLRAIQTNYQNNMTPIGSTDKTPYTRWVTRDRRGDH